MTRIFMMILYLFQGAATCKEWPYCVGAAGETKRGNRRKGGTREREQHADGISCKLAVAQAVFCGRQVAGWNESLRKGR